MTSITYVPMILWPVKASFFSLSANAGKTASEAFRTASEVTNSLGIELTDLIYLCYHASLASKGFLEMIETDDGPIMIHRRALHARKNVPI